MRGTLNCSSLDWGILGLENQLNFAVNFLMSLVLASKDLGRLMGLMSLMWLINFLLYTLVADLSLNHKVLGEASPFKVIEVSSND